MFNMILKPITFLSIATLMTFFLAGEAHAGRNCGGLNQKSCWHVNPAKWCDDDLQYKPTGAPGKGTCVKRKAKPRKAECGGLNQKSCWHVNPAKWCNDNLKYKPTGVPGKGTCVTREKKNCGNLNQNSCWHVNPARWCNGNLKYKPTGIPGQGTCIARVTDKDLKEVASTVAERMREMDTNTPLASLRSCLNQPNNLTQLRKALGKNSANGVNTLLKKCGTDEVALKTYGANVLGSFHNEDTNDGKIWHLSIGGIASGVATVGFEGGVGYRIALQKNPEARFYVTVGLSAGAGLAGGADIAVGLSYENMPTKHWARDKGVSVSYSGKYAVGGGISIDFPTDQARPSGFTLSGGVGAGGEAGVVTGSLVQYLFNF